MPVLRPGDLPAPAFQRPIWEMPRVVPPPVVRNETPFRPGKVPPPTKVGERKLGWRVGVLVDALNARERTASGA